MDSNQDEAHAATPSSELPPLLLRFSHNIIEHLGLKLYQNKPTNVMAELVSNSWDADAERVAIQLRTTNTGQPSSIVVADDGTGMGETELQDSYLIVGKAKRSKADPTKKSARLLRTLMGRKGIGKLAPFGVAKIVDLVTVRGGLVTWLRFDYDAMLDAEGGADSFSQYAPDVLARSTPLADVDPSNAGADADAIQDFFTMTAARGAGTLVRASSLTLKRAITPKALKEALGRRFTVTLARSDFVLTVNGEPLQEAQAFPEWEMRLPKAGWEESTFTAKGKNGAPNVQRTVRWWAGFVKEAAWSQEEAGVGVYAHGKIAQDRPFFFGMKGNEIFSRYLYAVVEADWIDELEHDAISTDRTSINWDEDEFEDFYDWGQDRVKAWIRAYEAHRKAAATDENRETVDRVIARDDRLTLRESEKQHLIGLLSDVTPRLGKDPENRDKLVAAAVRAWNHEPARQLIKRLWTQASEFDAQKFTQVVHELTDQLVPESLSLAVVFSQRVFALSQLERHIMQGKETQLQKLIEQFPWILDTTYESFVPRRALRTVVEEMVAKGYGVARKVHLPETASGTMPDFVFLGATVTGATDRILIVELKGPDDVASWPEYEQLHSYVSYLKSRYGSTIVEGILIAGSHDPNIKEGAGRTIYFKEWREVLLRSRKEHMELIAALLAGSEVEAGDARVQQICELGGEAVTGFLERMSARDPSLNRLVEQLGARGVLAVPAASPTAPEATTSVYMAIESDAAKEVAEAALTPAPLNPSEVPAPVLPAPVNGLKP